METPNGPRPIEDLEVGDEIWSVDPDSGQRVRTKVAAVREAERETIVLVTEEGSRLALTEDHPVYSPAHERYGAARHWKIRELNTVLRVGRTGMEVVRVAKVASGGMRRVFDLGVESELHNYIAGGILVHNKDFVATTSATETESADESADGTAESGDDGGVELVDCELGPGPGRVDPPMLVSGSILGGRIIRLEFTEPVAPSSLAQPQAFRLAVSQYADGWTAYADPLEFICAQGGTCTGNQVETIEIGCADNDPNVLLLRVNVLHHLDLCTSIDSAPGAILLAHHDPSVTSVLDADGDPLTGLGPAWVSAPGVSLDVSGDYPDYPNRVPIECE